MSTSVGRWHSERSSLSNNLQANDCQLVAGKHTFLQVDSGQQPTRCSAKHIFQHLAMLIPGQYGCGGSESESRFFITIGRTRTDLSGKKQKPRQRHPPVYQEGTSSQLALETCFPRLRFGSDFFFFPCLLLLRIFLSANLVTILQHTQAGKTRCKYVHVNTSHIRTQEWFRFKKAGFISAKNPSNSVLFTVNTLKTNCQPDKSHLQWGVRNFRTQHSNSSNIGTPRVG